MDNIYYNEDYKNSFLMEYNESTRVYYSRIFTHSSVFEKDLGKDVMEFNTDEIRQFLKMLEPETVEASRTNGRVVSAYLNWSIKNYFRKTPYNPLLNFDQRWYDQFVKDPLLTYITYEDLQALGTFCYNKQDFAIFALIFNGVQGQECSELRNLKKTDLNIDNKSVFIERNGHRIEVPLYDFVFHAVKGAIAERDYVKFTEDVGGFGVNADDRINLIDSDYVFRNAKTRTYLQSNRPITKQTIYRRIQIVRDNFADGEYGFMKVKNISKSGMIYVAKQMIEKGIKLDRTQYEMIASQFGLHRRDWWRVKEWANPEVVNSLYDNKLETVQS